MKHRFVGPIKIRGVFCELLQEVYLAKYRTQILGIKATCKL